MSLRHGRLVRAEDSLPMTSYSGPLAAGGASPPRFPCAPGRVAPKPIVDASVHAAEIVEQARAEASGIMQAARAERDRIVAQARAEGLDEATAALAASWLALRAREATADRSAQERILQVARVLAERLLGEALRVDSSVVVSLTREAMRHVWRADRVTIEAHEDDARALLAQLDQLPVAPELVEVVVSPERARGSVRIVSSLGTLDAALAPQLDRLVEAIRRDLEEP